LENVGTLRDQLEALVAEVDDDHAAHSLSGSASDVTGVCYESRDACSPGTPASDLADPQLLKDIYNMVLRDRNHPSAGTSSHPFPTIQGQFQLFNFSTFQLSRLVKFSSFPLFKFSTFQLFNFSTLLQNSVRTQLFPAAERNRVRKASGHRGHRSHSC
jgi:hypothetical protein